MQLSALFGVSFTQAAVVYVFFTLSFFWTFLLNEERCMRLSLCEAPTHHKEQHKGQPQHWELCTLLFTFSINIQMKIKVF